MQLDGAHEVIVVDGGSRDATCAEVEGCGAVLVRNPVGASPGIGGQLNQGARVARGDVLMFLHADVTLPDGAVAAIDDAMRDSAANGGGFLPRFVGEAHGLQRWMLRFVERVWRKRTKSFAWFAGDTAPFIRASVLASVGGYPMTGFASDWDFAAMLRGLGQLAVIEGPVLVDARRHLLNGVLTTLIVTGTIEAMYRLGINRPFLRRWYKLWLPKDR